MAFSMYVSLFVLVAFFMSYVCVHWECPYVGKFAPSVGGFCLPSSQLARFFRNVKRSAVRYQIFLNLAYAGFFGIILFPMHFMYQQSLIYLLIYLGIVSVYWALFTMYICPVCGTRHVCPGGQLAIKVREKLEERVSKKEETIGNQPCYWRN